MLQVWVHSRLCRWALWAGLWRLRREQVSERRSLHWCCERIHLHLSRGIQVKNTSTNLTTINCNMHSIIHIPFCQLFYWWCLQSFDFFFQECVSVLYYCCLGQILSFAPTYGRIPMFRLFKNNKTNKKGSSMGDWDYLTWKKKRLISIALVASVIIVFCEKEATAYTKTVHILKHWSNM